MSSSTPPPAPSPRASPTNTRLCWFEILGCFGPDSGPADRDETGANRKFPPRGKFAQGEIRFFKLLSSTPVITRPKFYARFKVVSFVDLSRPRQQVSRIARGIARPHRASRELTSGSQPRDGDQQNRSRSERSQPCQGLPALAWGPALARQRAPRLRGVPRCPRPRRWPRSGGEAFFFLAGRTPRAGSTWEVPFPPNGSPARPRPGSHPSYPPLPRETGSADR